MANGQAPCAGLTDGTEECALGPLAIGIESDSVSIEFGVPFLGVGKNIVVVFDENIMI